MIIIEGGSFGPSVHPTHTAQSFPIFEEITRYKEEDKEWYKWYYALWYRGGNYKCTIDSIGDIEEINEWLIENDIRCDRINTHMVQVLRFRNEQEAMAFKLRWL